MSNNIRISQLSGFANLRPEDYLALVDSSSLTTYKCTVDSLNNYMSLSGSAFSASWASSSLTATSASWASASTQAKSASYLIYSSDNGTASLSMNSISSSFSTFAASSRSSSFSTTASFSSNTISASYAKSASRADTASYFNFTPQVSSSWASASLSSSYAITSSFAVSSSHALTASYVEGGLSNNIAFATCYWQGSQIGRMQFSGAKGIYSASYRGAVSVAGVPATTSSYGPLQTWIIYMNTPMPSTNYTVVCGLGGEPGKEYVGITHPPFSNKTTNAFSISLNLFGGGGFNDFPSEPVWFTLMVLHP